MTLIAIVGWRGSDHSWFANTKWSKMFPIQPQSQDPRFTIFGTVDVRLP